MMTIEQITRQLVEWGISPKEFWAEAAGGDMTPMRREDFERVVAVVANLDAKAGRI